MTEYDPGTIRKYADQLYARANWIVAEYVIAGTVLGFLGGGVWGFIIASEPSKPPTATLAAVVAGALLGGLFYSIGRSKALQLKAQAQQMLCWVRIENNTRPDAELPAGHLEPLPLPSGQTRSLED